MTISLFKKCYTSNFVHVHLISVGTMLWRTKQVIRLSATNNTHRENLIQYKNLKNRILAAFDIFGVFTQFKFYNSVKARDA